MRPRQKHLLSIPVLAAAAVLFASCSVGRLSDRFLIDRMTQVTEPDGKEIPIGDGRDFLHAEERGGGQGLRLKPGDVLRYVRWSPGYADFRKVSSSGQTHEPASDSYEIALRKIGTGGRLHADEARFLSSILTVQRRNWDHILYGEDREDRRKFLDDVQEMLRRIEVSLWNSLADGIVIRRFRGGIDRSPALIATLDMNEICNGLQSVAPEDVVLFSRAYLGPEVTTCVGANVPVAELMSSPFWYLQSPLEAAVSNKLPNVEDEDLHRYFNIDSSNFAYAQFIFVEVEINGVRAGDRHGPAANWTLREWEESGVCHITGTRDTPVIRRIGLPGGKRKLWISRIDDVDPSKTYRAVTRLERGGTSRWLERIKSHEERAVLASAFLDNLRMSDLRFIEWGRPDVEVDLRKTRVAVDPEGCTFPTFR